jgi:hypothetical protein
VVGHPLDSQPDYCSGWVDADLNVLNVHSNITVQ